MGGRWRGNRRDEKVNSVGFRTFEPVDEVFRDRISPRFRSGDGMRQSHQVRVGKKDGCRRLLIVGGLGCLGVEDEVTG